MNGLLVVIMTHLTGILFNITMLGDELNIKEYRLLNLIILRMANNFMKISHNDRYYLINKDESLKNLLNREQLLELPLSV